MFFCKTLLTQKKNIKIATKIFSWISFKVFLLQNTCHVLNESVWLKHKQIVSQH